MKTLIHFTAGLYLLVLLSCTPPENTANNSTTNPETPTDPVPGPTVGTLNYLALGDSYTIGQSVCTSCRFPAQLKDSLKVVTNKNIELNIIATTGWTTTDLKNSINNQAVANNYDLVTLLIGVNNQYQNKPFTLYKKEFPELVDKAIALAKGDKKNVIVVSIPDYAYTPYGQNSSSPSSISVEIDEYNNFAKNYCGQNAIVFVDITPVTRNGLSNPALVADDGLHPSELAYTQFVSLILPKTIAVLKS